MMSLFYIIFLINTKFGSYNIGETSFYPVPFFNPLLIKF